MKNEFQYTNVATNTTTQAFTGRGVLRAIVINTAAAGSITLTDSDGTTTAGTIGVIKASAAEGVYRYDVVCALGLKVVTAASTDITIVWAKA